MNILLAGSTGYLGCHIVQELLSRQLNFKAVARNTQKLVQLGLSKAQIVEAQLTEKASLSHICEGMDVVISTLGITRQKDGLTYMDVDYQANKNLLEEAIQSGVKKFIYVSVLHGEDLTHLQICAAKERFVQDLQASGLEYCIIRPSGFFSDLTAFYDMAKSGRVYLFGDGTVSANPIHGADLAKVCTDAVFHHEQIVEVGGKEILSHQEIAEIAFAVCQRKPKITYIPDWVRRFLLRAAALLLSEAKYGTVEFFLNVMAMDMTTNPYGKHTIKKFFAALHVQDAEKKVHAGRGLRIGAVLFK
ncbi:MAG: SDR family oxidoreductase [Bacteroidetes bacterium]|nr:MAG: SDR family oxidoreductase [Bacteroidota bacterium]